MVSTSLKESNRQISSPSEVMHEGVVTRITSNIAEVVLMRHEACDNCRLNQLCNGDSGKREVFEVKKDGLKTGDVVRLLISESNGLWAVFWAYILPFLVMAAFLFGTNAIGVSETSSGVGALLLLVFYFLVLARFRKSLKSSFKLKIEKYE